MRHLNREGVFARLIQVYALFFLEVYPFVVPIDPTEESSFLFLPYHEKRLYRSQE